MDNQDLKNTIAQALAEFFPTIENVAALGDVQTGSIQSPYKEFPVTIAANDTVTLYHVHSYFRVLSYSGSGLQVRWAGSGSYSDYTSAGLGFKLTSPVDRVELKNTSGSTITLTVALGVGDIADDRLAISSTVNVSILPNGNANASAPAAVSVGTSATLLSAASSTKKNHTVQNLDASKILYIGKDNTVTTANGIAVYPNGGTYSEDFSGDLYGISPSGTIDTRVKAI